MKILSLLITYNSEKWIEKNINSIFQGTDKVDVLIIDNGSNDQTLKIIKEKFPKVRLIESKENLGFAKANNLGFEIAKSEGYDFVFLINHDGWLFHDFWKHVFPIISSIDYESYGLFSPAHFDGSEKEYDFGFKKYLGNIDLTKSDKSVVDIEYINGAFLLISLRCLKVVKGFDPIFFFYGEDIDLCLRVRKRGYKIGIIKEAKAVHDRKERKMTEERAWNHLVARYLIQIKSIDGGFSLSFYKTIYSLLKELSSFGKNHKSYLKLILYLFNNKSRIKKSYKLFN